MPDPPDASHQDQPFLRSGARPVLARTLRAAYLAVAIPATLLALSSYFAYTTLGFDFEAPAVGGAEVTYYRLRWDDGSTWAGRAVQPVPRPSRPLDWLDPGGTILASRTRPAHSGWGNDLGFWWIGDAAADPYVIPRYAGATASTWVACPSWLVLGALWLGPAWGRFARRAGRR